MRCTASSYIFCWFVLLAVLPAPVSAAADARAVAPPTSLTARPTTNINQPPPDEEESDDTDEAATEETFTPIIVEAPSSPLPPPPSPNNKPVDLGEPVASAPLADVDPESVGLLTAAQGGLGATMWDNTTRALVDRLLPTTSLPTESPALNQLARRFLLTTAAAPAPSANSPVSAQTLTSLRIEKLLAMGDVDKAWKLSALVTPDKVGSQTLRALTEVTLINPDSQALCAKVPDLIAAESKGDEAVIEWQKSQILCELRAGDMKTVQLGIDMLREQRVKDDVFLMLMNKNILGQSKQLPRRLTPLRPIDLAVLQQIDAPLPAELFMHPEAYLIPELVRAKAVSNEARLALAERAASAGTLSSAQLAAAYQSAEVTQADTDKALSSDKTDAMMRAALYQAAQNEPVVQTRIALVQKFLGALDETALAGSAGQMATDLIAVIPISAELAPFAPQAAQLFALAGRPEQAMVWLRIAREAAPTTPEIAAQLALYWPLYVLSGLVTDRDYAQTMEDWFNVMLPAGATDPSRRKQASEILSLLAAAGFAVPEDAWLRVMAPTPSAQRPMPPALLLERLRQAAQGSRRGETVLLALWLGQGAQRDIAPLVKIEIVRALRQIGLKADAQAYAREVIAGLR